MSLNLGKFFEKHSAVKPKEMAIFTNQLKVMLRSGIPIIKCLDTLERQASSERFKEVVIDMHKSVIGGQSLSQAMGNHPKVFSNLYIHMVKAGEATGSFSYFCGRLPGRYENCTCFCGSVQRLWG